MDQGRSFSKDRSNVRGQISSRQFFSVWDDDIIVNDSEAFAQGLEIRIRAKLTGKARSRASSSIRAQQEAGPRDSPDSGVVSDATVTFDGPNATFGEKPPVAHVPNDPHLPQQRFPSPEWLPSSPTNSQPPLISVDTHAREPSAQRDGPVATDADGAAHTYPDQTNNFAQITAPDDFVPDDSDGEDSVDSEYFDADGKVLPFGSCVVVSQTGNKRKCRTQCPDGSFVRLHAFEGRCDLELSERLSFGLDQVMFEEAYAATSANGHIVTDQFQYGDHNYCKDNRPSLSLNDVIEVSRRLRSESRSLERSPSVNRSVAPSVLDNHNEEDDQEDMQSEKTVSHDSNPPSRDRQTSTPSSYSPSSSETEDDCDEYDADAATDEDVVDDDGWQPPPPTRRSRRILQLSEDQRRSGLRSGGKEEVQALLKHKWVDDDNLSFLVLTTHGKKRWLDSTLVPDNLRFEYQIGRCQPPQNLPSQSEGSANQPDETVSSVRAKSRRGSSASNGEGSRKQARTTKCPMILGDNGKVLYYVENILGKRVSEEGVIQYLVKWKGCSEAENSWEPESGLHCPELVAAYNRNRVENGDSDEET